MTNRTYRMYGLVPYNISPIQQGIQFGHAVVEYGLQFSDTPEYKQWATRDKTFIILNGGTTNNTITEDSMFKGTLNNYLIELRNKYVRLDTFYEPDLGDQLTAIVFLVDDRVFDREAWPDYAGGYYADMKTPITEDYYNWKIKFDEDERIADKIIWLRTFLRNFRLA